MVLLWLYSKDGWEVFVTKFLLQSYNFFFFFNFTDDINVLIIYRHATLHCCSWLLAVNRK